jgi:hypothetical protein
VLNGTETVSLFAIGGAGFTVIVIVATLLSDPLLALKVKVSVPVNPLFGVYVATAPVRETVPCTGTDTMEYDTVPAPEARSVIGVAVPNGTVTAWDCATGGGGATVMLIVPVDDPMLLVAVNVKLSAPEYPFAGV